VELIYVNRTDPSTLSVLALAYAATQLVGMSLYGIDEWTNNATRSPTTSGSSRYRRSAATGRRRAARPLVMLTKLDMVPGTIPLLCAMIGSTSFDGFSQGSVWAGLNGTSGLEP